MEWNKQTILDKLTAETPDARLVYRALQALYARQTADEQATKGTSHQNGMGFNSFDAPILSDIAQKSQAYGTLTPTKQTLLVARKLKRYAGQLATIAAENRPKPTTTTEPVVNASF